MPEEIEIEVTIPESPATPPEAPVVVVVADETPAVEQAFVTGQQQVQMEILQEQIETLHESQSQTEAATIAVAEAVAETANATIIANVTAENAIAIAAEAAAEPAPEPEEDTAPGKTHWLKRSWREWIGAE